MNTPLTILTHRGLDSDTPLFPWKESSLEAFKNHLERGFGIEFDLNVSSDGKLFVSHDPSESGMTLSEIRIPSDRGIVGSLDEVLELITGTSQLNHALHIKGKFQNEKTLTLLGSHLKNFPSLFSKLFLFDVTIESATKIKKICPELQIAPSVAHPHDISRYNASVSNTLHTLHDVMMHRELFSWIWLDEWDRCDSNGKMKRFYTTDVFESCRRAGLSIALVAPELHRTSPGLLGGESHEDAASLEALTTRMREILALLPDAVCTDYPDTIRTLNNL